MAQPVFTPIQSATHGRIDTPSAISPATSLATSSVLTTTRLSTRDPGSSNASTADPPRMRSRAGMPAHPLELVLPGEDEREPLIDRLLPSHAKREPADKPLMTLNTLASCFERFFWRPSDDTRRSLMHVVSSIRQDEFALEGTDASSLVARILRSHGLLNIGRRGEQAGHEAQALSESELRSAVSKTLYGLAGSTAKLISTSPPESLAYLLLAAEKNKLLPELEALIARDTALCGSCRVIQSLWEHAEQAGLSLPTLTILIHLSERLNYPVPEDVPLLIAVQLILQWQRSLSPTHDEQDAFEAQLCALTGPETLPDDFEHLLSMAFDLGFCFADASLHHLVGELITEWECHPRRDQYRMKLEAVLELTGLSANDIDIDGEKALSRAVRTGNHALAALLLNYGADPSQPDARQQRPEDQLLRTRQALMSELSEIANARTSFTESQYKTITSSLLSALHRNEKMLRLFDMKRQFDQ